MLRNRESKIDQKFRKKFSEISSIIDSVLLPGDRRQLSTEEKSVKLGIGHYF